MGLGFWQIYRCFLFVLPLWLLLDGCWFYCVFLYCCILACIADLRVQRFDRAEIQEFWFWEFVVHVGMFKLQGVEYLIRHTDSLRCRISHAVDLYFLLAGNAHDVC